MTGLLIGVPKVNVRNQLGGSSFTMTMSSSFWNSIFGDQIIACLSIYNCPSSLPFPQGPFTFSRRASVGGSSLWKHSSIYHAFVDSSTPATTFTWHFTDGSSPEHWSLLIAKFRPDFEVNQVWHTASSGHVGPYPDAIHGDVQIAAIVGEWEFDRGGFPYTTAGWAGTQHQWANHVQAQEFSNTPIDGIPTVVWVSSVGETAWAGNNVISSVFALKPAPPPPEFYFRSGRSPLWTP